LIPGAVGQALSAAERLFDRRESLAAPADPRSHAVGRRGAQEARRYWLEAG